MAQHYGLTVEDLFSISWRRFAVLFQGIFSWKDDDEPDLAGSLPPTPPGSKLKQAILEASGADSRISKSLDWDKALRKSKPESKTTITTADMMRDVQGGSRN